MFHATARALRTAADQRLDDGEHLFTAIVEDVDIDDAMAALIAAPGLALVEGAIDREALRKLHLEFRWAESKLMQASERLAEAQDARRKDLVALACMRRELRASFGAEGAYVQGQLRLFNEVAPKLRAHELELDELVAAGAHTAPVIRELASVRSERKLYELAIVQGNAQLARIEDSDNTLEHEVASEAYNPNEPDGRSMRELARLRSSQTRAHRAAVRARNDARKLLELLGIDTTFGEITAIASFLAAEYEGETRAHDRVERIRSRQVECELELLPTPSSPWKAGLLHPVSWMRARKVAPLS